MEYTDPWSGANQGAKNLAALGMQIDQDRKMEQANKLAALQTQQAQLAVDEAKRKQGVEQGARAALTDGMNGGYTYPEPQGVGPVQSPDDANFTQSEQGPVQKKPNADRILLDYYMKTDPAKAEGMQKLMLDKFKALSEIDPKHAVDWYNDISGQNLQYTGKKGDYTIVHDANTGAIVAVNTKNPTDAQVVQQPTPKPEYEFFKNPEGLPVAKADKRSGKVETITDLAPNPAAKGGLPEVYNNMDYVYREPNATDAQMRLAELASETGTTGSKGIEKLMDVVSKQYTDKSDKTQIVEIPSPDGRTAQKFNVNTVTGEKTPISQPYKVKSQVTNVNVHSGGSNGTNGTDSQVQAWSDKIASGQVTLSDIPARGGIRTQVISDLAQRYPDVDLNKVKQNIKFAQSIGTMNSKALLNTINPLLDTLQTAGQKLGNSNIPGVNRVTNWVKEQTGNPDIVGFNNLRDDTIAEVERGLMGSGVLSDSKYQRALKNLNSAQSYPQLRAAIANIKTVISTRLESLANGPNGGTQAPQTTQGKRPLPRF